MSFLVDKGNGLSTNLCILELLLDFVYKGSAYLAYKAAEEEFWPDLAGTRHSPANAHQGADLVCSEISDGRN